MKPMKTFEMGRYWPLCGVRTGCLCNIDVMESNTEEEGVK